MCSAALCNRLVGLRAIAWVDGGSIRSQHKIGGWEKLGGAREWQNSLPGIDKGSAGTARAWVRGGKMGRSKWGGGIAAVEKAQAAGKQGGDGMQRPGGGWGAILHAMQSIKKDDRAAPVASVQLGGGQEHDGKVGGVKGARGFSPLANGKRMVNG